MDCKLVSIIIPIYNAEKYIERTIHCLQKQTYKNWEAILVDDGSKDQSLSICQRFASTDARIIPIHKENGGVSSARNMGLNAATGDYIGFLDADDYFSENMYELLVSQMEQYNADISICGFANETKPGVFTRYCEDVGTLTLSQQEQLKCLLSNKYFSCSCGDKLFTKELIIGVWFDEKITNYEDLLFLYEVMKKSNKAVFNSEPCYFYCTNQNTASTSRFNDKMMTMIDVWDYIIDDVRNKHPELLQCAEEQFVRNNLMCATLSIKSSYRNNVAKVKIRNNVLKYALKYLKSNASIGYKIQALLLSIGWPALRIWIKMN